MSNDDIVIGIGLGTTNSVACIYNGREFEIIPSALGNDFFPNVVAVNKNGELLVGEYAKKQMASNPENSVANVTLLMGRDEFIRFYGEDVRPQWIYALILGRIKRDAESYLSKPIKKAVISVPASFDDDARKATIEAGQIAGFEIVIIINDPTAACLAYATIKDIMGNILVFDISGGTLDITVGSFDGSELTLKSTVGYRIGGRNITLALREYVQGEFERINGLKLEDYITPDYDPILALYDAVETAKIELSNTKTTKIHIPSIVVTEEGEHINLDMTVHRSKLNELSNSVIERCEMGIADALSEAKLTKEDIGHLVFVGGPTKMPLIRDNVEKTLGISAAEGIDPMLCISQGASLYLTDLDTVPAETNMTNTNYDNQNYAKIELIEEEFKYVGYDKSLIEDLSSKFKGLNIGDKEILINIMEFFKHSELCFKDLHDLIRENVIEGNMPIDSFYKNMEYIVKSRIDENNRKLTRTIEKQLTGGLDKNITEKRLFDTGNVELDNLIVENEKLKNENDNLNEIFNLLFDENYDLRKENEELEEEKYKLLMENRVLSRENRELSNRINNFNVIQSDYEGLDNIFGDDFKNACSLNRISGINYEDYQKDLDVLASKNDIPEEELSIFKSAFKEYGAGNFNEAYELFNKFSSNFKWPQEYITFLKATSLSSANKIQEAYNLINLGRILKLGKKYDEDKYPILWFNFGNIYFDHAKSKMGYERDFRLIRLIKLSSRCYHNVIRIIYKSRFNYRFNFNGGVSEEEFKNDAEMMYRCAMVFKNLLELDRIADELKKYSL